MKKNPAAGALSTFHFMTTLLAATPGYGLTQEMLSRTDVLSLEVQTLLARRLGDSLVDALFKSGKFRTAPHFDAMPVAVKRAAGANVIRFAAQWDDEHEVLWIDASLRHSPSFASDVIAIGAWALDMPGDKLLDEHYDQVMSQLFTHYEEVSSQPQGEGLESILLLHRFLRGARAADAPQWQRRHAWTLAAIALEKLRSEKIEESVSPEVRKWFKNPCRRTLKALGLALTAPAELAFLRLSAWAQSMARRPAQRFTRGVHSNPYVQRGLPLAAVVTRPTRPFPTVKDWFGVDESEIAAGDKPSVFQPFTGPVMDVAAHFGKEDLMPFSPAAERPLGSFDVRPLAVLRATSTSRWSTAKPIQAALVRHSVESRSDNEATPGPLFPFVGTPRETPVVIRGCEPADTLAEAWLQLSAGSRSPVQITAYAAHWANAASALRAEASYTTHLWLWAVDVKIADGTESPQLGCARNGLPVASAVVTVQSVAPLAMLLGRRYLLLTVTWPEKALGNVPVIVAEDRLSLPAKGCRLAVRGLFAAGAFFNHTKEARADEESRLMPPERSAIRVKGESVARMRRGWIAHPTAVNRLLHAATMRPRTRGAAQQRMERLRRINTPASVLLLLRQGLVIPDQRAKHLPEILYTVGQLLAAGFTPAREWLTMPRVIDLTKEEPTSLTVNLLLQQALQASDAKAMCFIGDQLLEKDGASPHDKTEGMHWLLASAIRGFSPAILRSARHFATGDGVAASIEQCLGLVSSLLKTTGSPEVFYLYGALQLMGADFYYADSASRRSAIVERLKKESRPGNWVLLILHLLFEPYPESEGKKPLYAALQVARSLIERTSVTTAAQLVKLAESRIPDEERAAALGFDAWGWLKMKAPTAPVTFAELTNPISDTLMQCLQSEAFFDDLVESLSQDNETSFLAFVEQHLVPMAPGIAARFDNPSSDGIELAAYVGIADTTRFSGATPALGCIRAADRRNAGQSFFFPFFPEGLAVRFRREEAYATHDNAAAFLRIELQDENGFPVKSLVVFDPVWAAAHASYDVYSTCRGTLAGVAEKIFTAPDEMKSAASAFMTEFEDTLTETPPAGERPGLYACGGLLEEVCEDFTDIAGLTVTRVLLTIRMGGRRIPHFPVYLSKNRLLEAFPDGLPAAGSVVFAEINLHCLTTDVTEDNPYAGRTLQ